MGAILGLPTRIVVPISVSSRSREFIKSEKGANVVVCEGSYDDAVAEAALEASKDGETGLLIQDTSWEGYETIPLQIVQGYKTLFSELDPQISSTSTNTTTSQNPILVAVPVGVGSLAHSSVLHYRATSNPSISLLSVEPTKAPCLLTSLLSKLSIPISTSDTIMPGLNCGTVSPLAWPDLRAGIDNAVAITDEEALAAMGEMKELGLKIGPCGAAPLAGVQVFLEKERSLKGGDWGKDLTVILICTEGDEVYRNA